MVGHVHLEVVSADNGGCRAQGLVWRYQFRGTLRETAPPGEVHRGKYGLPDAARALPLSLPDTDSLFLQFAATFINRISVAGAAGAPALYDHLAGFTDNGDGAALLVALELLTRHHTRPPYIAGLATALASSVCALLAVASDVIFAGNWPRGGGGAIAQTLQAGGRAVALAPLESCFAPLQACPAWAIDALLGTDGSHTMSLTDEGGSVMAASMQGEARALFGHTCVRLVALLEHVLRSPAAVSEMLNGGRVAALLEALAYDLRATDAGVFLVQRHMVRALASLLATASRSYGMLLVVRDRKVMRLLLALLGPASAAPFLPPVLRVELCQLLVFTLLRSSGVSSVLVSDFETDGQGYRGAAGQFTRRGTHWRLAREARPRRSSLSSAFAALAHLFLRYSVTLLLLLLFPHSLYYLLHHLRIHLLPPSFSPRSH